MAFIGDSNLSIQKKLQKVEGALGMPISQRAEIAFKVFNGRNHVQEKREQQRVEQAA